MEPRAATSSSGSATTEPFRMDADHTTARRRSDRRGQTALEYILVFIALLTAAFAAVRFLRAPGKIAVHTTDVICSERL